MSNPIIFEIRDEQTGKVIGEEWLIESGWHHVDLRQNHKANGVTNGRFPVPSAMNVTPEYKIRRIDVSNETRKFLT